ncbi:MAG: hypothetical protein AAGE93_26150, partial [Bacteroidota bacterium]
MQEVKKIKLIEKFGDDGLARNNSTVKANDGGDEPISSALSKPDINWLQNRENRTKIEGAPGNLWISNKPLWVSEMSK